jgi:hypothetical protein
MEEDGVSNPFNYFSSSGSNSSILQYPFSCKICSYTFKKMNQGGGLVVNIYFFWQEESAYMFP